MRRMSMGTDDTVNAKVAAEILGVTTARVYQMKRDGMIRTVGDPKKDTLFDRDEICALAEERDRGAASHLELQQRLVQTTATARRNERRLKGLERMLGLRCRSIGYDDEEIRRLYLKAKEALKEPTTELIDTREWYEVFLAIHEEFFDLVEAYTHDPEPWRPFIVLAQKMYQDAPALGEFYNEESVATKAELDVARRNLRAAAWVYLCNRRGRSFAEAELPDTDPDPITHLLNNHTLVRHP